MSSSNQTYKELAIPYFREVFEQIDEVMSELQVPYYLIGANAIALQLLKQGILPGRSTKDIDFAVMVSDMPHYEQIVIELEKRKFEKIAAPWTFYYADKNAVIDILPFGEIAQNDTVRFAKMYSDLHVLGFTEVLQNAEQVHIEEKAIGIPTLPGMVLLKLIAWSDRPEDRENDIADILKIIDHYYELNEEEILDHYHDTFLESEEFDRLKIAAEVLGRKATVYLKQNEGLYNRINDLIAEQLKIHEKSPIAQRWSQIKGWEISYSIEVLSAFQKGLKYKEK